MIPHGVWAGVVRDEHWPDMAFFWFGVRLWRFGMGNKSKRKPRSQDERNEEI
jgi:hypothetical protein